MIPQFRALSAAQEFLWSFRSPDHSRHALHASGAIIIWLCFLPAASFMATWKTSRSDFRSSSGRPTSGSWNPTPSTRCTGSRGKPSPPPATRRSWATPKSWRYRWSRKTIWGRRKGRGWGCWVSKGPRGRGLGEGTRGVDGSSNAWWFLTCDGPRGGVCFENFYFKSSIPRYFSIVQVWVILLGMRLNLFTFKKFIWPK